VWHAQGGLEFTDVTVAKVAATTCSKGGGFSENIISCYTVWSMAPAVSSPSLPVHTFQPRSITVFSVLRCPSNVSAKRLSLTVKWMAKPSFLVEFPKAIKRQVTPVERGCDSEGSHSDRGRSWSWIQHLSNVSRLYDSSPDHNTP